MDLTNSCVHFFVFQFGIFSAGEANFGPTRIRACYMGGQRRDEIGQAKCVRLHRRVFLLFFEKDMWWRYCRRCCVMGDEK